ncbi:MAG: hypothetical protein ACPHY8_02845 [Patescibacteria group bacterium]
MKFKPSHVEEVQVEPGGAYGSSQTLYLKNVLCLFTPFMRYNSCT